MESCVSSHLSPAGFILSQLTHKRLLYLEVFPHLRVIRTMSRDFASLFPSLHILALGNQRIIFWGGIFQAADHFALSKARSKDI